MWKGVGSSIRARAHTCVRVHLCVCACVRVRTRGCVRACVRVRGGGGRFGFESEQSCSAFSRGSKGSIKGMSAAEPSLGPDECASPFPHVYPAWSPPRGGHIFQPPSPTGPPLASHLGLHPLPTGTPRKQGQPRSRAPSGKGGVRSQADSTCRVFRPQRPPSLPGDCLAGQGVFLGPGFGGGHGVCPRPLPRGPFHHPRRLQAPPGPGGEQPRGAGARAGAWENQRPHRSLLSCRGKRKENQVCPGAEGDGLTCGPPRDPVTPPGNQSRWVE